MDTLSSPIILISGKQGSGKSTIARALKAAIEKKLGIRAGEPGNDRVVTIKFADPVYRLHDEVYRICAEFGVGRRRLVKDGLLLQLLGTEWGQRKFGWDVWGKIAAERAYSAARAGMTVIIDDLRFIPELACFTMADTLTVRLNCQRDIRFRRCESWRDDEDHVSETQLDDYPELFMVKIDTAITSVEQSVEKIINELARQAQ